MYKRGLVAGTSPLQHHTHIYGLILSVTKFSDLIGSLHAYLPCMHAIMKVSNHRYPMWAFCNQNPLIGYLSDSHVNIVTNNAFLASFAEFPTVFRTYEKRYRHFHFNEVLKIHFNSEICYRYD